MKTKHDVKRLANVRGTTDVKRLPKYRITAFEFMVAGFFVVMASMLLKLKSDDSTEIPLDSGLNRETYNRYVDPIDYPGIYIPYDPSMQAKSFRQQTVSPDLDWPDNPEEECNKIEALIALQEITIKTIKIQSVDAGVIQKNTAEWNEVYNKSIVEPLNAASQIHCDIIKKNRSTNTYHKEDARQFVLEYIKQLNKAIPELERISGNEISVTLKGVTVNINTSIYQVSANMTKILAKYANDGVIERLGLTFEGDIAQYFIMVFDQQPLFSLQDVIEHALENHSGKPIIISTKGNKTE